MTTTRSRLSPVDPADFTPADRDLYDQVTSGRFNPNGPTAIWSRNPRLAVAALDFGDYVRWNSTLDPLVRELVVLTTAVAWDCENEWVPHEALAREAGAGDELLEAVRDGAPLPSDDPLTLAAVAFARRLHEDRDVDDETYDDLHHLAGDRGIVDIISTIGFYTMIAMLLKGTRAPLTRPAAAVAHEGEPV